MFKIGDCVMYGTIGVCKVVDIVKERFINNELKEYYVLDPVFCNNTTIKIPVDNKKIQIRKVISKEQLDSIIEGMPDIKNVWIDDSKVRTEKFNKILKSCKCEEIVKLISNIDCNKEAVQSKGKKQYQADENIMKEAKRLLSEEFAVILNISPDEVDAYIEEHTQD